MYSSQKTIREQREQVGELIAQMTDCACHSRKLLWDLAESCLTGDLGFVNPIVAEALDLCHDCPVQALCEEWATLDNYTGLAAGRLWVDGRPHHSPSDYRRRALRRERDLNNSFRRRSA